jgi:hypothetical protein
MRIPGDNSVQILFRFYSDILEEETVETLWAEVVDADFGYYRLKSMPFYAPKIACDDMVWAEFSEADDMLTYRKTIEFSGNSTIHVIILDNSRNIAGVRDVFRELGCESEKANDSYFALDVPANRNYFPVKKKLDELEKAGVLDCAESCLSDKHQYKSVLFGR